MNVTAATAITLSALMILGWVFYEFTRQPHQENKNMSAYDNDQSFEKAQHGLNDIIDEVRKSRVRKEDRHPGKFDERLAAQDTYRLFAKMPQRQAVAVLAAALHRLAVMEDYNPVSVKFPEIADLDFVYDPKDDPKGE